jgi:hypothetical protein
MPDFMPGARSASTSLEDDLLPDLCWPGDPGHSSAPESWLPTAHRLSFCVLNLVPLGLVGACLQLLLAVIVPFLLLAFPPSLLVLLNILMLLS